MRSKIEYIFSKEILDTYTRASIELNIFLLTITESPRRYISDKTVGGFIYVLSISYLRSRRYG